MKDKTLLVFLLLTLGVGSVAMAESLKLLLDPESTAVRFTLGATLHTVEGSFALESGELVFDPETGEASGEIVVDIAAGDSGSAKRDRQMHDKILESGLYPSATFRPESFAGDYPSGSARLSGTLNFHGDDHAVEMPLTLAQDGDRLRATGTLEIPFVEWGLKDPSTFVLRVEKTVEVTIEVVGRPVAAESAS
ncbi:MAG: YceI family protein [Acidobacteriota bacterium]